MHLKTKANESTWSILQHNFRDRSFSSVTKFIFFNFFFAFIFPKHKTCLQYCCSLRQLNRKRDSNALATSLAFRFLFFCIVLIYSSLNFMAFYQEIQFQYAQTICQSVSETLMCTANSVMFDVATWRRANQCSFSFLTQRMFMIIYSSSISRQSAVAFSYK